MTGSDSANADAIGLCSRSISAKRSILANLYLILGKRGIINQVEYTLYRPNSRAVGAIPLSAARLSERYRQYNNIESRQSGYAKEGLLIAVYER